MTRAIFKFLFTRIYQTEAIEMSNLTYTSIVNQNFVFYIKADHET